MKVKKIDENLIKIAKKLIEENKDAENRELMKKFAKENPNLKKKSQEMFNALKELRK